MVDAGVMPDGPEYEKILEPTTGELVAVKRRKELALAARHYCGCRVVHGDHLPAVAARIAVEVGAHPYKPSLGEEILLAIVSVEDMDDLIATLQAERRRLWGDV